MTGVAVLGPGGVGGLIAGALARAGVDVTVVARDRTAEVIARDGIRIESETLGDFSVRPEVVNRLAEPAGVLVVATKATGLAAAIERIATDPALVVPLLNGLDHVEFLRRRFGANAVAGSIRVESHVPEPGRVVHTSPWGAEVSMASADSAPHGAMGAFVEQLRAAGISAEVLDSEARVMWRKLVRLCSLALTTTAFDETLGEVLAEPAHRAALQSCLREAAAVAQAEGVETDAERALAQLDADHPGLDSSMHRDVRAGRQPELDAIAGAVLRAGALHGIECRVIESLAARAAQRAGIAPPDVSSSR